MTLKTRLTISTLLGLCGMLGLAVLFYLYLPEQADEVFRRESQSSLERVAADFPQALASNAEPLLARLQQVALDPRLTALEQQNEPSDMADQVDLAHKLAKRYSLDNLVLIDHTGVLRSLHPDAARVGMRDAARLELAKAAIAHPVLAAPFRQVAELGKEAQTIAALVVSVKAEDAPIWALATLNVTRDDLHALAARHGARLADVNDEAHNPAHEDSRKDMKVVALKGLEGRRILTVTLAPAGRGSQAIKNLLVRHIVMIAAPWAALFTFLMVWTGWPRRRTK